MRKSGLHFAAAVGIALFSLPNHALAQVFQLPATASLTEHHASKSASQRFPVGVFSGADTETISAHGRVDRQAYTLTSTSLTTLQLLTPLRAQFEEDGFRSRFACADTVCGGFDFRFLLDILPEPQMHVDLGDFQYIVMEHPDGRVLSAITSRGRNAGFIQVTTVIPQVGIAQSETLEGLQATPDVDEAILSSDTATASIAGIASSQIAQDLQLTGSVVLEGLEFDSGSSALGAGPFASLEALAAYILSEPQTQIALVGHTDASGGLSGNISLSKKRAASVRERLIEAHNVPASQVSAEGVGYLAPRASNTDELGREQNRRVEAVVTSTP